MQAKTWATYISCTVLFIGTSWALWWYARMMYVLILVYTGNIIGYILHLLVPLGALIMIVLAAIHTKKTFSPRVQTILYWVSAAGAVSWIAYYMLFSSNMGMGVMEVSWYLVALTWLCSAWVLRSENLEQRIAGIMLGGIYALFFAFNLYSLFTGAIGNYIPTTHLAIVVGAVGMILYAAVYALDLALQKPPLQTVFAVVMTLLVIGMAGAAGMEFLGINQHYQEQEDKRGCVHGSSFICDRGSHGHYSAHLASNGSLRVSIPLRGENIELLDINIHSEFCQEQTCTLLEPCNDIRGYEVTWMGCPISAEDSSFPQRGDIPLNITFTWSEDGEILTAYREVEVKVNHATPTCSNANESLSFPSVENRPLIGNTSAPVTMVVFSRYSQHGHHFFENILPELQPYIDNGTLRISFRTNTMRHRYNEPTTSDIAADCVYRLTGDSAYVAFHNKLLAHNPRAVIIGYSELEHLTEYALELGVAEEDFLSCVDDEDRSGMQRREQDYCAVKDLEIEGDVTSYVNTQGDHRIYRIPSGATITPYIEAIESIN